MSVITPTVSATSDATISHHPASPTPSSDSASPSPSPRKPAFQRPIAPEPDTERDNELLNFYFDGTMTTKDIADHFKLPVSVIAAWFQRSDIAAVIDFVAAANERRARDIARESLPGTIDILQRISRLRNDDKTARAASSALIRFSRGQASTSLARSAGKQRPADGTADLSAAARARRAGDTPPRGMQDTRDLYTSDHDDTAHSSSPRTPDSQPDSQPDSGARADDDIINDSPGRNAEPAQPNRMNDDGASLKNDASLTDVASQPPPQRNTPFDLAAHAGLASHACNACCPSSTNGGQCRASA